MIDLESLQGRLRKGESIEDMLARFDWKELETTVLEIFAANGFFVWNNLRFKTGRRYEIDVLASKVLSGNSVVLSVDCKSWSHGRYKTSGLLSSARMQAMRTRELERFVSKNHIARYKLRIEGHAVFQTILVTLFDEYVDESKGILVIPVCKLNSFLNSL